MLLESYLPVDLKHCAVDIKKSQIVNLFHYVGKDDASQFRQEFI